MKPLVIHLIGDRLAGGSNFYVNRLINSPLNQKYNFLVLRLDEFKSKIASLKPDSIFFHYPCTWRYLLELVKLKRYGKVIILDHHYCQGFEQDRVSVPWRFHLMLKIAYSLADYVLCVSNAQKEWMLSRQLVDISKVRVIQVSVSGAVAIEDLLKIPPKSPEHPLVLCAYGRFARQKGFDVLLNAIASLPAEDFNLYLGGYGFEEAEIQKLARNLSQVKLVGVVRDVPGFLALCDAVVIPSRWETGAMVGFEAKAAGKAIVASDIDALPELVGSCGLLVPPNDVRQLAKAIASLPEQNLVAWGQAARESVAGSWERLLGDWESLLEEIII